MRRRSLVLAALLAQALCRTTSAHTLRAGLMAGVAQPDGRIGGNVTGLYFGFHGEWFRSDRAAVGARAESYSFEKLLEPPHESTSHRVVGLSAVARLFGRQHSGFLVAGLGVYRRWISVRAPSGNFELVNWDPGMQIGVGLTRPSRSIALEASYVVLPQKDGWSYIGRLGAVFLMPASRK